MNLVANRAGKRHTRSMWVRLSYLVLLALCQSSLLTATEADNPAWRNFQHALGEPALIAANADHPQAHTAYRPIPELDLENIETDRFRLGFALFHDGRLSSGNAIACITCHAGAVSGVDGRRVSIGVGGARGTKNALPLFNAAFNFRQFWDGRAVTLEDQALEPIQNAVEMANTLDAVLQMLQDDARYSATFTALYPDGVTIGNMTDAITYFQRINFIRRDTPFQRQLTGRDSGLDDQALRGWQRFDEIGCTSCHNGINLGGNSYQQLGEAIPYYGEERTAGPHDAGVMERSGRDRDRHVFKVPGLHGVATTAPYFHDGSVATLDEAIREMAEHQLGTRLGEQDVEDIAGFLRSLSGRFDSGLLMTVLNSDAPAGSSSNQKASHHESYLAALAQMEPGGARLLAEMQKLHRGEIAHFDFVQFEHLELIRHARALHHPPSSLDELTRTRLISHAETLLAEVTALEWMIADFLRAEAMIRVFGTYQSGSVVLHPQDSLGDVAARLHGYREQSSAAVDALSAVDLGALSFPMRQLYEANR